MTRLNLARSRRVVEYRTAKRREAVLLLRRFRRVAPDGWRERLIARFAETVRREATCE